MKKYADKECCTATLDMYCDELHEKKKLSKESLNEIKIIFNVYPELKNDFPNLVKAKTI